MRFVLPFLLIIAPAGAAAQLMDTTSVPKELAMALLAQGGRAREILVGRSASEVAQSVVPPGTSALGAVSDGMTIFVFGSPPGETDAIVRKHLKATGWSEPMEAPLGVSLRGFTAVGGGRPGSFTFWCKDSSAVSVAPVPRPGGGTYINVYTMPKARSVCDEATFGRPGAMSRADDGFLEPPVLNPPDGSVGGATGSSGSDRDYTRSARYESKVSAEQMVAHFGAQMEKAGWTFVKRSGTKEIAMYAVKRTDDKGVACTGVLLDVIVQANVHSLQLQLAKNIKYPWEQ